MTIYWIRRALRALDLLPRAVKVELRVRGGPVSRSSARSARLIQPFTFYMIYMEPLFMHVNFKPTNHYPTVLFNGMIMIMNGTQLIRTRLSVVIKLSSRRYFLILVNGDVMWC